MKIDRKQHDEAVSSVVGEMIMVALVIILVALFATSAFSLIPGGREASVDVAMKNASNGTTSAGDTTVIFWHKGGDWVEENDLAVVVIKENGVRDPWKIVKLHDHAGNPTGAFDLGGYLVVEPKPGSSPIGNNDTVRLVTQKSVAYSGVIP